MKVWLSPSTTETAPAGEIDPPAPALAVIVCSAASPIAKSLKVVIPVACVLVAVRVPAASAVHVGLLNLRTLKMVGFAPASTSLARKLNVAEAEAKAVPP